MPNVGKYVIEAVIILGTLTLAAFEFLTKSSALAAASLSVFLAAGSRIAPTLLRIQQNILAVKSSSSAAVTTLDLLEKYSTWPIRKEKNLLGYLKPHENFSREIILNDVSFKYPETGTYAVRNINLCINSGELIALVGPSGAGKSTLVDLILGALLPESGEILISGETPRNAIRSWPGLIAYVPQQVFISSSSVRENLLLGLSESNFPDEAIWSALDAVQLTELVKSFPNKLVSHIGDGGSRISGGQKQRVGIARALLTKPQIIVLDEATSSLDAETEETISRNIQALKGRSTVVIVAHRLSTVRNADKVVYLGAGTIQSFGTFDEVRQQIPDFDRQATLMGL
jgi:ABC-type multidrug transport system fused ATPase/permease subunit